MPSPEASRMNLAKARENWRPPRPWRSQAESRLIRMLTWQWLLGHGPWCSGRALAKWLVVSHTYVQKLARTLSINEVDFLNEVRYSDPPTIEALKRARDESRKQRDCGLLRTPRRWKTIEVNLGHNGIVRAVVPAEPTVPSLGTDPPVTDAPTNTSKAPTDYDDIHVWQLRIDAQRHKGMRSPMRRWRPGMRFRP